MQYGHCVTWATATAISCLIFTDNAPSANTFWLKAWKAASVSRASKINDRGVHLDPMGLPMHAPSDEGAEAHDLRQMMKSLLSEFSDRPC
jgi:hypothetical protein